MAEKMSMKNVLTKEYVALLFVGLAYLAHFVDEIINHDDIAPLWVYTALILSIIIFPFSKNKLLRIFLLIASAIGCSLGMVVNHIIPYYNVGDSEGIVTAVLVLVAGIHSIYRAVMYYLTPSEK